MQIALQTQLTFQRMPNAIIRKYMAELFDDSQMTYEGSMRIINNLSADDEEALIELFVAQWNADTAKAAAKLFKDPQVGKAMSKLAERNAERK